MTGPAQMGPPQMAPAQMGRREFIALMGMLSATVAFSLDAMLPALGEIGAELAPMDPDRASLLVVTFVLGMGLGTFVTGTLSDRYGRKPVMIFGAALFIASATVASLATSLETILVARFVQGLGASGPRVVALAVIRDRHAGREMARILSFVMIVFTLVPVFAPTLGAWLIWWTGWRGIFYAFSAFALVTAVWLGLRLPETLPVDARRPIDLRALSSGCKTLWSIPAIRLSIMIQALHFSYFFANLSTTQLVFDQTFGRAESFHLWFGAIALVSGTSALVNARLVMRFGMRRIIFAASLTSTCVSGICALIWSLGLPPTLYFASYVIWQTLMFFQAGMSIGNVNAVAMEPAGKMAGLAASLIGALSTVVAAALSAPIVLAFNGTPVPVALACLGLGALSCVLAWRLRQMETSEAGAVSAE